MSFASDLKKFRVKAGFNAAEVKKAVGLKLFSAIVRDTPVGTSDPGRNYVGGRLRANWQVVRNGDTLNQLDKVDPSGAAAFLRIQTVVGESKLEDTLVFVNNLPYGPRIEFDGWSHTKAPRGMVRINVTRFQRLIAEAARKARNK